MTHYVDQFADKNAPADFAIVGLGPGGLAVASGSSD